MSVRKPPPIRPGICAGRAGMQAPLSRFSDAGPAESLSGSLNPAGRGGGSRLMLTSNEHYRRCTNRSMPRRARSAVLSQLGCSF